MDTLEFLNAELENVNEKMTNYIKNGYGLKIVNIERDTILKLIKKYERLENQEVFDEEEQEEN